MAATISFLAGSVTVNNLAGSGLGFYGAAFGASVPVGSFQTTTFITSADGTQQGPPCHNTTWLNQASGQVDSQTSGIPLRSITNLEATLNIRLTNGTAVKTQNAQVKIYDRFLSTNPATGVTTKVAELCHPDPVQNQNGSGSTVWTHFSGVATATGVVLNLAPSPGVSGLFANGVGDRQDVQHDWFLVISASPDSVGSKQLYGLYFYTEYL